MESLELMLRIMRIVAVDVTYKGRKQQSIIPLLNHDLLRKSA